MGLFIGADFSSVLAATAHHHHKQKSPKIVFSKLTNQFTGQPLSQSQHICPVHFHIMNGPYCKMKFNSPGAPKSASKNNESTIAAECGGLPFGSASVEFNSQYKVATSAMPGVVLTPPCFVFIYYEFIDYSQGYFNPPDKPPKLLS